MPCVVTSTRVSFWGRGSAGEAVSRGSEVPNGLALVGGVNVNIYTHTHTLIHTHTHIYIYI